MRPDHHHVCVAVLGFALLLLVVAGSCLAGNSDHLADSIIPPWLDAYGSTPNITVTITFNNTIVIRENGQLLTLTQTSLQPHVQISGPDVDPYAAYTFIIVDPDAFNPTTPLIKNVIHWIISNIPGSTMPCQDIAQTGTIVLHYLRPRKPLVFPPPYGTHRYYNLLFKQPTPYENVQNITSGLPSFFSTRKFTQRYNLGYPVAGMVFEVDFDA